MKKENHHEKTIIALTALTLVLTLSGCADSSTQSSDSAAETTAVITEAETTATTEETLAETVTEAETTVSTGMETSAVTETTDAVTETTATESQQVTPVTDEAPLIALTYKLLQEYEVIDGVCAFGLSADINTIYETDDNTVYNLVTDGNFEKIDDLKQFFGKTVTGDAKAEIEKSVFEGEHPIYIEHDGHLYMLNGGRGSGFGFQKDTIKVYDITNDGFKATLKNNQYGAQITDVYVTIVKIDGEYLISSFE